MKTFFKRAVQINYINRNSNSGQRKPLKLFLFKKKHFRNVNTNSSFSHLVATKKSSQKTKVLNT